MTEEQIIDRLKAVCEKFQTDEYDEWAAEAIPVYQQILDDAGLVSFAAMAGQPNGDFVDEILLRTPWGDEKTFPDPEMIDAEGKTTYLAKYVIERAARIDEQEWSPHCYIEQLVIFFMEQIGRVRTLDRVKNMREAINYLEAAICAEEPTSGASTPFVHKPEERDRCLKEAMVHVSVAMRPEPAKGAA